MCSYNVNNNDDNYGVGTPITNFLSLIIKNEETKFYAFESSVTECGVFDRVDVTTSFLSFIFFSLFIYSP